MNGAIEAYIYDSQNWLIGYTSSTTTSTYAYDALDRRIAKTVGGVQTAYVYDTAPEAPLPFDDIVLEFSGAGTGQVLTRRWAHSDAVDEPLGFEAYASQSGVGTGVDHAVFADRQGSVIRVVTPATGTVVAAYQYDAYGRTTQTSGTLVQPYGYTGREYDAESGMYHYRARAYDPAAGVFLQVDPLELAAGSFAHYKYTSADPLNWSDPSGLSQASEASGLGAKSAASGLLTHTTIGVATINAAGRIIGYLEEAMNLQNYPRPIARSGKEITCTKDYLSRLEKLKPKDPESCKGNLAAPVNLALMSTISGAILARTAINAVCYRGTGDGGHDAAIAQLYIQLNHCYNLITKGRR